MNMKWCEEKRTEYEKKQYSERNTMQSEDTVYKIKVDDARYICI